MFNFNNLKLNSFLYSLNLIILIIIIIIILCVSVAFFTLFERKVIGRFHYRKGPNKVSFMGILQPFRDAIKLFRKEIGIPIGKK